MKRNRRIEPDFAQEIRFNVGLAHPAPSGAGKPELEQLKDELLLERLEGADQANADAYVRHAASEAAALAWVTPYPLLVFPVLFEEKADAALARLERQTQIREQSRELLAV